MDEIDEVLRAVEVIRPFLKLVPLPGVAMAEHILTIIFEAAVEVRSLVAQQGQAEALRLKLEEKVQAALQARLDAKFG